MKREVRPFILCLLLGLLTILVGGLNMGVQAQQNAGGAQNQKRLTGLVVDWMNDFEDCEDWRALSTCPLGETKIRKIEGRPVTVNENGETQDVQIELSDENGITHGNKYVLGVKTYILDRGFDRVEVFPPNEYIIRGKAKEIKVWVLGRKFRHTLYVKLRDYRGNIHKLKIGRLDFWGWREMSVVIPGWLPQAPMYGMLDRNLHFVSFYVESDNYEVPGTFYFYLDNFRVTTDLTEFTGDSTIKDNW